MGRQELIVAVAKIGYPAIVSQLGLTYTTIFEETLVCFFGATVGGIYRSTHYSGTTYIGPAAFFPRENS